MPDLTALNGQNHFHYQNSNRDKTILFLGSLGSDLTMWDRQADTLQAYFNVLRMDLCGLEKSLLTERELTIADHGQDVIDLMDAYSYIKSTFVDFP